MDIDHRKLKVAVSPVELDRRRAAFRPRKRDIPSGRPRRYAAMVENASKGAVLRSGS